MSNKVDLSKTKLFEKFVLNNGVVIPNRLAIAPMYLNTSNEDGSINDYERNFHKLRSENVGLYIFGASVVNQEAIAISRQTRTISEADLPSHIERAKIVKANGAIAISQLHHPGREASKKFSGLNPVVPSADIANELLKQSGRYTESDKCVELTEETIEKTIQDFANATELSLKAGYDGIEIHGANNYLIQQFFSGYLNRRTDKWGGSVENRMRFALAVVDACVKVREKYNKPEFIIGYRLSPEEPYEDGITMTDTLKLVQALEKKPIQYMHISQWNYFRDGRRGEGSGSPRLKTLHSESQGKVALIGVGDLRTCEDFNKAINSGYSDIFAAANAFLMNKNFGTLLKENRESEINTELDTDHPEYYELSPTLWELCLTGQDWLPPLKKKN